VRILCFYDTVSALIGESFAAYRSSVAKWLCMLYVPAVVGAVGFTTYDPVPSVIWSAMVIGESAVNKGISIVTGFARSQKLAWMDDLIITLESEFDPACQTFKTTAYE
jgi:cyanate permease